METMFFLTKETHIPRHHIHLRTITLCRSIDTGYEIAVEPDERIRVDSDVICSTRVRALNGAAKESLAVTVLSEINELKLKNATPSTKRIKKSIKKILELVENSNVHLNS